MKDRSTDIIMQVKVGQFRGRDKQETREKVKGTQPKDKSEEGSCD